MHRESLQKTVRGVTFEGVKGFQFRPIRLHHKSYQEPNTLLELYQLARQLHQSVNLTEMLRTVLAQTLDLAHAEMSCVILLDDRGVPAYWMTSDPGLSLTELSLAAALHDGLQGQSLQRQQTIYVADHLHRGNGQSPLVPGRSFLVVPLSAHGKITGVLTLAHPNPRAFTMQHKALLIEAAEVIGLALHNAQAYTQLHTTTTANDEGKYRLVHDIRSPLMSVSASIEVIRRVLRMDLQDPALQSMIRESVDNAQRSLKAVLDLSNDLLDTKKLQIDQTTIEYQPVVLELLCDEVMGIMRSLALQRHIMLSYQVTPRTLSMMGDAALLRRMLVNLTANALRFTPEGGTVTLKAGEITLSESVLLVVEDTGSGVAPADRERIFEPFAQGKGENKRGTGLGLTVCREVARAHGGRIWVEDRPGGGSRFCSLLPMQERLRQIAIT